MNLSTLANLTAIAQRIEDGAATANDAEWLRDLAAKFTPKTMAERHAK